MECLYWCGCPVVLEVFSLVYITYHLGCTTSITHISTVVLYYVSCKWLRMEDEIPSQIGGVLQLCTRSTDGITGYHT